MTADFPADFGARCAAWALGQRKMSNSHETPKRRKYTWIFVKGFNLSYHTRDL